jgi:hypothetical protein
MQNNNNYNSDFSIRYLFSLGEGLYQLKQSDNLSNDADNIRNYVERLINHVIEYSSTNQIKEFLTHQYNHACNYGYGDLLIALLEKHSGESGTIYNLHNELLIRTNKESKQFKYVNEAVNKINFIHDYAREKIDELIKKQRKPNFKGFFIKGFINLWRSLS